MTFLLKTLGIPALVIVSIVGLAAAIAIAWLLLPEIRPTLRSALRHATAPLRHRRAA